MTSDRDLKFEHAERPGLHGDEALIAAERERVRRLIEAAAENEDPKDRHTVSDDTGAGVVSAGTDPGVQPLLSTERNG